MPGARWGLALLAAGLCMVLLSVVFTCITLGSLGDLAPTVRPATAAEAPVAEHVAGTVVAEPGSNPPLVAGLQALAVRLLLLGLLAGAGAGLCTWALLRRKAPPGEAPDNG